MATTATYSDEDDDDRETLVPQNHVHPAPAAASNVGRGPLAFDVDAPADRTRPFLARKRFILLAACIPIALVFIFSPHFGRLFSDAAVRSSADEAAASATEVKRMQETELRLLHLLRNQQLGLRRLYNWKPSSPAVAAAPSPYDPASGSLDEFRSVLREQIEINIKVQNALISSSGQHWPINSSFAASGDNVGYGLCQKAAQPASRYRKIEWRPKRDRYLFAICLSGQMSNHLICLEKHMLFAALLDRVLIMPSPKLDYHYSHVLDIAHINECFGRQVVISFEEFSESERKNKQLRIDQFICYVSSPPCYIDEEHIKRLKNAGISLSKIEVAWPEDTKLKEQKKRSAGDITSRFSSDAKVLAVGDVFFADVEDGWGTEPGGPLAHKCRTVIQPSRLIMLTAQRLIQTYLGSNFVALHFRRHGYLKFCNVNKQNCFFPIPQAAECILRVIRGADAPVIYLSTDADDSETDLLQSMLVLYSGRQVPLIKRPEHHSSMKWDALLYRHHLEGDPQVEAMLDKTICAMSSVFIGTRGSTFTDDIFRLRRAWGSASNCDELLCQGELPNYTAENE